VRIHGRTRKQVYTHFLEVEKPALKPLSAERFSLFEVGTSTVHLDGYVGKFEQGILVGTGLAAE
jgi:hypothetical protein